MAIFWGLVILLLSGLPGNHFPDLSFWSLFTFDKFSHLMFYAVFTVLLTIGEVKHRRFSANRSKSLWIGFLVAFTYGILVELLQAMVFHERFADVGDVIANTIGCILGVIYFKMNFQECLKPVRW